MNNSRRIASLGRALLLLSAAALAPLVLAACSSDVSVGALDSGADAAPPPDTGTLDASVDGADSPDATSLDAGATCTRATGCGAGEYCHTPVGSCGGAGACEPFDPSAACDVVPVIVCGCDGHSYSNACAAERAGSAIDHDGACPPFTAGCTSDFDCDGSEFCELNEGACGGEGTCTSRGIGLFCADICDPQCGCDRVTYQNPCLRRKAGMSLNQPNTCPGDPPPCTVGGSCCVFGTDCPLGQFCYGAHPGVRGKCLPTTPGPACWTEEDCGTGRPCVDAFICPCDSTCPRPDAQGTCM